MMVNPLKARGRWALPLVKVMPGVRLVVELGGDRWWWFGAHWLERLFLCVGDGCEGCVFGPPRVMGYRVAWLRGPERPRPVLLECPLTSVAKYESLAAMEALPFGRGASLSISRRHRRSGVSMEPEALPSIAGASPLSDVHTLQAIALIFALPELVDGETPAQWVERVKPIAHARLVGALAKQR